ncbi:hypothetical protein ACFQ9B_35305, partial [Streptomyces sp. NPDC056549]
PPGEAGGRVLGCVSTMEKDVSAFLGALEHGRDVTEAQAPPAALDLARGFAEAGVPLSTLLRTYRLGHAGLLQLLQDEVTRSTTTSGWRAARPSG